MKKIHTLRATAAIAFLSCHDEGYNVSIDIPVASLPSQARAVWEQSLAWFQSQGLRPGEALAGEIILDLHRDAVVDEYETQTIEGEDVQIPTAWRHVLTASAPVQDAQGRRRETQSTTEDMPPELRAAFLALVATTEAMINS